MSFLTDDLPDFFLDFGVLVTLNFVDGTHRTITAIFDAPALNTQLGTYDLDTNEFQIRARTTDVVGLKWRQDSVTYAGQTYDVSLSPQHDGTGISVVKLGLPEHA